MDDKRFFTNEPDESEAKRSLPERDKKKEEEEKKEGEQPTEAERPVIELPDLDESSKPTAPPPLEPEPAPESKTPPPSESEPPKQETPPPSKFTPTSSPRPTVQIGKKGKNYYPLIIYGLAFFLCISFFVNVFFGYNISSLKTKSDSEAKVIESLVTEKEGVTNETKSLKNELENLKGELGSNRGTYEKIAKQNANLKEALAEEKEKYSKLESTMQEYAEEVRGFASEKIKYYEAYEKEKENAEKFELAAGNMEKEVEAIKDEFGSVDKKYRLKEAAHIYNMAFVYIKAGMFDDALKSFRQFLELNGEDADTHYNMGFIYENVKLKRAEAIAHYNQYIKLKPDAEDVYEVKMKVSSLERASTPKKQIPNLHSFKIDLRKLKF